MLARVQGAIDLVLAIGAANDRQLDRLITQLDHALAERTGRFDQLLDLGFLLIDIHHGIGPYSLHAGIELRRRQGEKVAGNRHGNRGDGHEPTAHAGGRPCRGCIRLRGCLPGCQGGQRCGACQPALFNDVGWIQAVAATRHGLDDLQVFLVTQDLAQGIDLLVETAGADHTV